MRFTTANSARSLSGLAPNTTYHYRIDANNSDVITYGADVTFTTAAPQARPTVQTLAAIQIHGNSAVFDSTVNPNGADTTAYFNCKRGIGVLYDFLYIHIQLDFNLRSFSFLHQAIDDGFRVICNREHSSIRFCFKFHSPLFKPIDGVGG